MFRLQKVHCLPFFVIFSVIGIIGKQSVAEEIFVYVRPAGPGSGDPKVIAGKVVSISDGVVMFDLGCRGNLKRYISDDYFAIHYNNKCRGSYRIDSSGGDDDECGAVVGRGSRNYQYVKTNNDKFYALRSVSLSGASLRGVLLLSGRTVSIPRASLDVYAPSNDDCGFRSMRN